MTELLFQISMNHNNYNTWFINREPLIGRILCTGQGTGEGTGQGTGKGTGKGIGQD